MICSALNSDLGFILLRPIIGIMGCLFGCFRIKDDNRPHTNLVSDPISSKSRDPLASQNRLASLLLSEDKEGSPCKDTSHCSMESPCQDNIDRELKEEAKFLKYCGTLLETPVEIRKTSERVKDLPNEGDSESSKFHSWLSSAKQPNLVPISPVNLCDELGKESGSSEQKPISFTSKGLNPEGRNSSEFDSSDIEIKIPFYQTDNDTAVPTTQCKNKTVRFECPSSGQSSKQSDSSGSHSGSKHSPYPTPLKLTDEIQTPGTVYPVSLENLGNRKIRSQYITYGIKSSEGESTVGKVMNVDASLSPKDERDRPILGTVAAHWNDNEPLSVSPKWWDGNGIPNSTNKYKEDQRVSWHATPFEERLEKALSDESLVYQRKLSSGRPVHFDENEENDTAASRLQSSTHLESVVSF